MRLISEQRRPAYCLHSDKGTRLTDLEAICGALLALTALPTLTALPVMTALPSLTAFQALTALVAGTRSIVHSVLCRNK